MFDTVCIVGVGLIGGSFGLALRERKLARRIVGASRRQTTIEHALERGAIDEGWTDVAVAARGADLIFMAPPVGQMADLCRQIAPVVRADAIVTDAGSTKAAVIEQCTRILGERAYFVGGHPMAGSEKTGVEYARADLVQARDVGSHAHCGHAAAGREYSGQHDRSAGCNADAARCTFA